MKRAYSMELRSAAADATRERILDAAYGAFLENWYDHVTIAQIARDAGVSGQTVLNHFGGKEQLFAAVHTRIGREIHSQRGSVEPGDLDGAIEALVEEYEQIGDAVIRMLALEEKVPSLGPLLDVGRASHRQWVERVFEAPDRVPELVVATDVYAWKLLRRDQDLTRDETAAVIRRTVQAILTTRRSG
jgi:AcrR family transcriptional regulator